MYPQSIFEQKYSKFFPMKFSIFASENNKRCLLHGHVFVIERERERERERVRVCNNGDKRRKTCKTASHQYQSCIYNLSTEAAFEIPQSLLSKHRSHSD